MATTRRAVEMTYDTLAWAAALLLLGGVLCFVPLFDALGYEWCLAVGVAAAFAGTQLGAAATVRWRRRVPTPTADDAGALVLARLYGRIVGVVWLMLLPPLVAIVANALRVRNCDLGTGLGWFALLPLPSAAMGVALGMVVALARPWRSLWAPSLTAMGGIFVSALWGFVRYHGTPPVFAYDPFVGYLAGPIYDEDLRIGGALVWARLYHAALALTSLATCALFLDGPTRSLRARSVRDRPALLALVVAFTALAVGMHARRARLGFDLDAGDVARALGAEKQTAHFVLHYSPHGPYAARIDEFALDFELRWHQHARLFQRAPALPVHAFLFDSPAQKRALVGASNTMVTKGWRRETYLHYDGWPQPALAHELAHIFASQFGDPLFGSSHHGLHLNVALMEGIPVAAEWSQWQPLTPHQIAKVVRDAKLVGDDALLRVMGPGFYAYSGGISYALAGSFCRFLLDTRGAAKLMELHRAGGSDNAWRDIYGVDLATLAGEWRQLVDRQTMTDAERDFALAWLRRPSLFGRPCVHTVALARQAAVDAAHAGERQGALARWQQLCTDDAAIEARDLSDAADAALVANDAGAARLFATRLLARQDLDDILRGQAETALGDAALLDGDVAAATDNYQRAARRPMDEWRARTLTLKQVVCGWPAGPARTALVRALVSAERESEPSLDLADLAAVVAREPRRAVPRYVLARQLAARGQFDQVAALLSDWTVDDALPDGRCDRDRLRLLGEAAFHNRQYARARQIFDRLAADPAASEGLRRRALDWRDRCDFAQQLDHR